MMELAQNACAVLENPRDAAGNSNSLQRAKERFKRRVAAVYGTWKAERKLPGRDGDYPSRPIAHVAQGDQWPANYLFDHIATGVMGRVRTTNLKELGQVISETVDELEALERSGQLTS